MKRCFQAGFTILIIQTYLAHAPTASFQFDPLCVCVCVCVCVRERERELVEETSENFSLEYLETE